MGILLRAQKQAHWSLACLSGALEFDWSLSRGSTDDCISLRAKYATYAGPDGSLLVLHDDCISLRAKYATYAGPDGSLLVLQIVSVADYFVIVIVKQTNVGTDDCSVVLAIYATQYATYMPHGLYDLGATGCKCLMHFA
jgi:hypothetical protein